MNSLQSLRISFFYFPFSETFMSQHNLLLPLKMDFFEKHKNT